MKKFYIEFGYTHCTIVEAKTLAEAINIVRAEYGNSSAPFNGREATAADKDKKIWLYFDASYFPPRLILNICTEDLRESHKIQLTFKDGTNLLKALTAILIP